MVISVVAHLSLWSSASLLSYRQLCISFVSHFIHRRAFGCLRSTSISSAMELSLVLVILTFTITASTAANWTEEEAVDQVSELTDHVTRILDSFSQNYDKRVQPNYGGEAVDVGITMFVISVSSLSEVKMDFTVDFYFRQMWKDPRLSFNASHGIKTLSVGAEFLKNIWVPDTFFVNEKSSYFHQATTSNEFLRISAEGDVLRSIRLTVTATCPMDLKHFPMDSQLCNIEIESFGYTMADIRYKWAKGEGSFGVSNDVSLPQFLVWGYKKRANEIKLSTGNYSRLACDILFVRRMGYYYIQVYIPSSLIVIISWVSFWLNRSAAPARVNLGITTVLTMTTLMSSTNKALPKISYVKSIDSFIGTCFVMVFAALCEYAAVTYLDKRIQARKAHFEALQKKLDELQAAAAERSLSRNSSIRLRREETPTGGPERMRIVIPGNPNQICGITPSDIDKYSRVAFPVLFMLFNLFYWVIYNHISAVDATGLVILQDSD